MSEAKPTKRRLDVHALYRVTKDLQAEIATLRARVAELEKASDNKSWIYSPATEISAQRVIIEDLSALPLTSAPSLAEYLRTSKLTRPNVFGNYLRYTDEKGNAPEEPKDVDDVVNVIDHITGEQFEWTIEKEEEEQPTTVREWIEQLPDGYRERALEQCVRSDYLCDSMRQALDFFADWRETEEKRGFWWDVYNHYLNGTPLPPLPEQP